MKKLHFTNKTLIDKIQKDEECVRTTVSSEIDASENGSPETDFQKLLKLNPRQERTVSLVTANYTFQGRCKP